MSVDPKSLKVGDRVNLTISCDGVETKTAAVVICNDAPRDSHCPLFWLDAPYKSAGVSSIGSYELRFVAQGVIDSARKTLKQMGVVDDTSRNIWHISGNDTVIDSVKPVKTTPLTLKALQIGDRVEITIQVGGEEPFTTMATALGTSYGLDASPNYVLHLDTKFDSSRHYSFDLRDLYYYQDCHDQTKVALDRLDLDSGARCLWSDGGGFSQHTTINKYYGRKVPKDIKPEPAKPIDQNELEVGDDIEIEVVRNGKTYVRTATVVATAKDERDHFNNDSETGVILHQEIKDPESPSFEAWSHWQPALKKLKLPDYLKLGWRLYTDGRNKTKITKKLGKRVIDAAAQADLTPGRRIETPVQTKDGIELVCGTIINVTSSSDVHIVLDGEVIDVFYRIGLLSASDHQPDASKFGLQATSSNLLTRSKIALRGLPEKVQPIPDTSLDEAIQRLKEAKKLTSDTVALDGEAVKAVLAYAIEQRAKEKASTASSNPVFNPPFKHLEENGTTKLEFQTNDAFLVVGTQLDKLAKELFGIVRLPTETDFVLRRRLMQLLSSQQSINAEQASLKQETEVLKEEVRSELKLEEQSVFKTELADAGWRVAAAQASKAGRQALLSFIKVKAGDEGKLALINDFLESEYGRAFLELSIGCMLRDAENPTVARLADEWRVDALATTGNEMIGSLLEFVLPAITSVLETLPETRVAEELQTEVQSENTETATDTLTT